MAICTDFTFCPKLRWVSWRRFMNGGLVLNIHYDKKAPLAGWPLLGATVNPLFHSPKFSGSSGAVQIFFSHPSKCWWPNFDYVITFCNGNIFRQKYVVYLFTNIANKVEHVLRFNWHYLWANIVVSPLFRKKSERNPLIFRRHAFCALHDVLVYILFHVNLVLYSVYNYQIWYFKI